MSYNQESNIEGAFEVNFDSLVGPTHNYGGLSEGNIASIDHKNFVSNPREAALQGLEKMKFLMELGVQQAVLPPHPRPSIPLLNNYGFRGTTENIYTEAKRHAPWLFRYGSSSSSMWAANAASVTPSIDSAAKKIQFTPSNLTSKLHRSLETPMSAKILKTIFANPVFFEHHEPLFSQDILGDEGAANHIRFAKNHYGPGVHLFVYGNSKISDDEVVPQKYPARQSLQASQAITTRHQIYEKQVVYAQQNPAAIDKGVFHNDVISTGNLNFYLVHEQAFVNTDQVIKDLNNKLITTSDTTLHAIKVLEEEISMKDAVSSYLFNSQIVTLPDGFMTLLAPKECQSNPIIEQYISNLVSQSDNPIHQVHYFDLRESMNNGGGPACLRLQIIMNETELREMNQGVRLTPELYKILGDWIRKNYRDQLRPLDLMDINLLKESDQALDELTQILKLGSIYPFQL